MIIDCGSCAMASIACDDCVVTALLGPVAEDGPTHVLPDVHARALDALAEAGLVPPLRLVPLAVISHEPPNAAAG